MPRGGSRPGAGRKSTDPISESLINETINNLVRDCNSAGLDPRRLLLQLQVKVTWASLSRFSRRERELFATQIMQLAFSESD
jgi:hypothetical protein